MLRTARVFAVFSCSWAPTRDTSTFWKQTTLVRLCGVPGNSIQDAIYRVSDVLAHAEATGTLMCVLTLDFQQAFDRISRQYLFHILQRYGISPWFVERIHALYDQAMASVQINGSLAGRIPIRSGVRQGCPLSVALYALCLHPLISALEDSLPSIKIGRNTRHGPVIAFANDVTVFVTNPGDFHAIQQAIHLYERATGARLNPRFSHRGLDRAPDSPGHILS